MAFLANFALFFVFFLPLTLAVGVPFDFYVGRYQPAEEASQLFYWILVGWPLLLSSVLFVPVAHIALAIARRGHWNLDRSALRKFALAAFPLGLLAVHLLFWGTVVFSVPLLATFLIRATQPKSAPMAMSINSVAITFSGSLITDSRSSCISSSRMPSISCLLGVMALVKGRTDSQGIWSDFRG